MSNLTFEPGTSRQFAAMHQSVVLGAKRTRTWPTMTGLQASDSRYFVGSATGDLVQLAKGGGGGRRPFEIRPSGTGMYDTFGDKRALFLKAPEVATLTRCWSLFWIHAVASVHAHVQPHSLPRFRVYQKQSR